MIEAWYPWEVVTLDFLCGLEAAERTGHTALLVMCDRFSRRIIAQGCADHLAAEETVRIVMERLVLEHGLPRLFITDRGPQFESTLWLGLWDALQSRAALAATHHPQTDGLSERTNRSLLDMIRKFCQGRAKQWEGCLPYLVFAMNSARHARTGCTPFETTQGWQPMVPAAFLAQGAKRGRKGIQQAVTIEKLKEKARQAWDFVRRREAVLRLEGGAPPPTEGRLQPGDEVLVQWDHLKGMEGPLKTRPRMGGPYLVKAEVAPGTYALSGMTKGLPTTYHRSFLKPYRRPSQAEELRLHPNAAPLEEEEGGVHREVEKICGDRMRGGRLEYYVQWKGVPERNWEAAKNLGGCEELVQEYKASSQAREVRDAPPLDSPVLRGRRNPGRRARARGGDRDGPGG